MALLSKSDHWCKNLVKTVGSEHEWACLVEGRKIWKILSRITLARRAYSSNSSTTLACPHAAFISVRDLYLGSFSRAAKNTLACVAAAPAFLRCTRRCCEIVAAGDAYFTRRKAEVGDDTFVFGSFFFNLPRLDVIHSFASVDFCFYRKFEFSRPRDAFSWCKARSRDRSKPPWLECPGRGES